MVYQDRHETFIAAIRTPINFNVVFYNLSYINFEANIVAEQKKALLVTIILFFKGFIDLNSFTAPLPYRCSGVPEEKGKIVRCGALLVPDAVPLPRGAFRGLALQKKHQSPQIETWNTINQLSFCQFLECQTSPHKPKASWKLSGDGSDLMSVWKWSFWNLNRFRWNCCNTIATIGLLQEIYEPHFYDGACCSEASRFSITKMWYAYLLRKNNTATDLQRLTSNNGRREGVLPCGATPSVFPLDLVFFHCI